MGGRVEHIGAQIGAGGPDDGPGLGVDPDLPEECLVERAEHAAMAHDPAAGVHDSSGSVRELQLELEAVERPDSHDARLHIPPVRMMLASFDHKGTRFGCPVVWRCDARLLERRDSAWRFIGMQALPVVEQFALV